MSYQVLRGDCVELMAGMPAGSVDAVVCDPPYGLEFMGKDWDRLDAGLPQENVWKGRRGQGGSSIGTDDSKPSSRHHVSLGAGKKHAFKRCTVCGKRQFSGSPCECLVPEWSIEYPEGAPSSSIRMQRWHQAWATEALRVLKPGGHLLAFGGTRTYHRLACAVEDAGFEIRDTVVWMYGSGFPKSRDVSKAIDHRKDWTLTQRLAQEVVRARTEAGLSLAQVGEAMQVATNGRYGALYHRGGFKFFETALRFPGRLEWEQLQKVLPIAPEFAAVYDEAEREVLEVRSGARPGNHGGSGHYGHGEDRSLTAPATPEAEQWSGWGTALKPAHEPIVVARKPLAGTVAGNVLEHGTGALNVDGCRVGDDAGWSYPNGPGGSEPHHMQRGETKGDGREPMTASAGRWPANVVLDEQAAAMLDEQTGDVAGAVSNGKRAGTGYHENFGTMEQAPSYGDSGGASRFFYVSKAGRRERNAGLDGFEDRFAPTMNDADCGGVVQGALRNSHPT